MGIRVFIAFRAGACCCTFLAPSEAVHYARRFVGRRDVQTVSIRRIGGRQYFRWGQP